MRKLVLASAFLALVLSGCGSKSTAEGDQPADGTQAGAAKGTGPASQGAPPVGLNPNAGNPDSQVGSKLGGN